jgi:hypothetical protein
MGLLMRGLIVEKGKNGDIWDLLGFREYVGRQFIISSYS